MRRTAARNGPRGSHQIGHRLDRQGRIDHEHERHAGDQRDRHEIVDRVVGQLLVERDVDGERRRSRSAACSRPVPARATSRPMTVPAPGRFSTMTGLPSRSSSRCRTRARDDVDRAAGAERHDQGDRPRRIVLRDGARAMMRRARASPMAAYRVQALRLSRSVSYCDPASPALLHDLAPAGDLGIDERLQLVDRRIVHADDAAWTDLRLDLGQLRGWPSLRHAAFRRCRAESWRAPPASARHGRLEVGHARVRRSVRCPPNGRERASLVDDAEGANLAGLDLRHRGREIAEHQRGCGRRPRR